jgi:hypothetical protein
LPPPYCHAAMTIKTMIAAVYLCNVYTFSANGGDHIFRLPPFSDEHKLMIATAVR